MRLLEVSDLFRFYHRAGHEVRALRGVDLMVQAGEIVALTGPSGSGKSTLLSCIAGLDEPDGGTVDVEGRRMTRRPEAEKAAIRLNSLGLMAQWDNLFAHLTVADNLGLVLRQKRCFDALRIAEILDGVGLSRRAHAYPRTLSGGEKARAGLAVALAADAPLLVADEPTAEVDARTEGMILNLLVRRRDAGGGALIATHSPGVEAISSRVVHLSDGRVVGVAERRSLLIPGGLGAVDFDESAPVTLCNEETILSCNGVSRTFGEAAARVEAVDDVTLAIRRRDRISIMGPSGSGKSTLLSMLAGLIAPSAGAISWFGKPWWDALRPERIAVVFQEPSLIPSLTVRENVDLPLLLLGKGDGARPLLSSMEALELLSLADLANKLPDELSGGQMQRVAFARALVTAPDIVLADEPTGQLDRPTGEALMTTVFAAFAEQATALIVATHDPVLAARMALRWRMDHGHLKTAA